MRLPPLILLATACLCWAVQLTSSVTSMAWQPLSVGDALFGLGMPLPRPGHDGLGRLAGDVLDANAGAALLFLAVAWMVTESVLVHSSR